MERLREWRYPVGTRLRQSGTGRLYTVRSDCRKLENGKYGYAVEDALGNQDRITLDEIILREKYCLVS